MFLWILNLCHSLNFENNQVWIILQKVLCDLRKAGKFSEKVVRGIPILLSYAILHQWDLLLSTLDHNIDHNKAPIPSYDQALVDFICCWNSNLSFKFESYIAVHLHRYHRRPYRVWCSAEARMRLFIPQELFIHFFELCVVSGTIIVLTVFCEWTRMKRILVCGFFGCIWNNMAILKARPLF